MDNGLLRSVIVFGVSGGALSLTLLAKASLAGKSVLAILFVSLFSLTVWSLALDSADKSILPSAAGRIRTLGRAK